MESFLILTINPGSTTTKIALFENENEVFRFTITHSSQSIQAYEKITDQYIFRKEAILEKLKESNIDLSKIKCIVGRGGLIKPIPSGVYEINNQMITDLKSSLLGEHASNLGGLLAHDIAADIPNSKAFIVDPVVVDELDEIARFSGHPLFKRRSIFHALNQKAIAKLYAKECNKNYQDLNLIVVHLGGGISVGAHYKGRVIDVNDGLNGDGPFSPERSGSLTTLSIANLCFSGDYSYPEIKRMIIGEGGIVAYLGTNNIKEVEEMIQSGDDNAKKILDAMCYQTAKYIGSMAIPLKGEVDAILLTGGIAHSKYVIDNIWEYISFLAPIKVYPGEDEMKSLALGGLGVLQGSIEPSVYK